MEQKIPENCEKCLACPDTEWTVTNCRFEIEGRYESLVDPESDENYRSKWVPGTPGLGCPYKTIERLMGLLVEVNDGFNLWPDSLYKRVSEELAKWN